jgi:hypothetical protein
MAADPSIPIDPVTLGHIISDQRRASRAFLYPWIRLLSRAAVTIIVAVRRLCPVRFAAPAAMDRLCLLFLRRCVCPTAVSLLIRHFIVETNLLNFCIRNAAAPGLAEAGLRPTRLAELGDSAVIEHDLSVYRVLLALGSAAPIGARDHADLDFSMLTVPAVDPEPLGRRFARLDIQTALCLMNIPFAFCLTPVQYRRAVHSLRLDTSLLTVLAALTGDTVFLSWRPAALPVRVDTPMLMCRRWCTSTRCAANTPTPGSASWPRPRSARPAGGEDAADVGGLVLVVAGEDRLQVVQVACRGVGRQVALKRLARGARGAGLLAAAGAAGGADLAHAPESVPDLGQQRTQLVDAVLHFPVLRFGTVGH